MELHTQREQLPIKIKPVVTTLPQTSLLLVAI